VARPAWVYAAALAVAVGVALLAVPSTRAALVSFIQIGVVRLQVGPTATPTPAPATGTPPARPTDRPTVVAAPSATPRPTATPLGSVLDLAGETTLAEARAQVSYPVPLPSYPADLGAPDRVFVQDLDGQSLVLVWTDPADPNQAALALFVLTAPYSADKLIYAYGKDNPQVVHTLVDDQLAVWTTGPYVLHTQNGRLEEYRLIAGHVLVWADSAATYRLETTLPLDEAVRIAESLEPWESP
jgi:hypothetical protein